MSDGITDSYRDQKRGERYDKFLKLLADYLENKTPGNLQTLKLVAESVDGVPRGLMTGKTRLAQDLDSMLVGLQENDQRTWGELLLTAIGRYPDQVYGRLKKLSPFASKILISVDYGLGFVTFGGELESILADAIGGKENLKIYDTDKYLVAIPESALTKAKVIWLRCGIHGVKEPRKARTK